MYINWFTCNNAGDIDFRVWLCSGFARDMCAQHFWGFPLCRPALLGIPTLPTSWTEKGRFPTLQPL